MPVVTERPDEQVELIRGSESPTVSVYVEQLPDGCRLIVEDNGIGSNQDEAVGRSYDVGASSFVTKPGTFEALVGVMNTIGRYWFEVVELPEP